MGFLAKLKAMFSHNIVYTPSNDEELAVLYKNKSVNLRVGSYIVIEENATCVIVHKGVITDYLFGKGKFRVDRNDLPRLFDAVQSGKNPDRKDIPCEVYFVKANKVEKFAFASSKPFIVRSAEFGKVVGQLEGVCNITITSVRDFFAWLFMIRRHFKTGKIDMIVSEQIGNLICKVIEKSKIDIKDMVLKNINMNEYINMEIIDSFEALGFEISDVALKGMQFKKSIQEKINAMLQREYEKVSKLNKKYITISSNGEVVTEDSERAYNNVHNVTTTTCNECGGRYSIICEHCPYCGAKKK